MNVEIRYPRFESQFGRQIAFAQLYNVLDDSLIMSGSLAQILEQIATAVDDVILVNAQDVLDLIVRQNGFAA